MKKLIFISAISLFAFGCGSSSGPANNTSGNSANSANITYTSNSSATALDTSPATTPLPYDPSVASDTIETEPKPKVESVADLKGAGGHTASAIKLWESKQISDRLQKIMGAEFAAMKKNWNTEAPVTVSENVAMLSGCQKSNCGANNYVIFADTANDNINILHIKDGKSKKYNEKGEITLPKDFSDALNKIGANAN